MSAMRRLPSGRRGRPQNAVYRPLECRVRPNKSAFAGLSATSIEKYATRETLEAAVINSPPDEHYFLPNNVWTFGLLPRLALAREMP